MERQSPKKVPKCFFKRWAFSYGGKVEAVKLNLTPSETFGFLCVTVVSFAHSTTGDKPGW